MVPSKLRCKLIIKVSCVIIINPYSRTDLIVSLYNKSGVALSKNFTIRRTASFSFAFRHGASLLLVVGLFPTLVTCNPSVYEIITIFKTVLKPNE